MSQFAASPGPEGHGDHPDATDTLDNGVEVVIATFDSNVEADEWMQVVRGPVVEQIERNRAD